MPAQFTIEEIPFERRLVADALYLNRRRSYFHALVETDITEARKVLKETRVQNKVAVSLTAYLMQCFAQTLEEMPEMQAFLVGQRRYTPHQVDLFVPTLTKMGDASVLLPKIMRNAAHKSMSVLEADFQEFYQKPQPLHPMARAFLRLPAWMRQLFYRLLMRWPTWRVKQMGTAYFTAVNSFVTGRVTGIPAPMHSVGMLVVSISRQQVFINEQWQWREILHYCISVDHEVNDGALANSFIQKLKNKIADGPKVHVQGT